jgi:flavin reductase
MTRAFPPRADRAAFIEAMSRLASSVSVVTTDGPAGRDGLAVSAMVPVSADPGRPTLLVCVNRNSRPAPAILANGAFCVNVLGEDQAELCERFAGRRGGTSAEWFARSGWSVLATGAPALEGALAAFDCTVAEIGEMGSHHVIFGAVEAIRSGAGKPLLHAGRAYRRLSD